MLFALEALQRELRLAAQRVFGPPLGKRFKDVAGIGGADPLQHFKGPEQAQAGGSPR